MDVVVHQQVVAGVCEEHAAQLGEVQYLKINSDLLPRIPMRVYVDAEKAEGWHLVASLVNSKDRLVLYPPGVKLPPEPIWKSAP